MSRGRRIVAMTAIPMNWQRGGQQRGGLAYARFGQATWRWWCRRNGVEFVLLDRPLGGEAFSLMPPTVQRWLAPAELLGTSLEDQVAVVDADTMIRWDAPDFFSQARGGLAAVRGNDPAWIHASIEAFGPLFPGVSLPWWEYFNAGLVVLGPAELPVLRTFVEHQLHHRVELMAIQRRANVGTDQTPLNLTVRQAGRPVTFLPPPFNLLNCFAPPLPLRAELLHGDRPLDPEELARRAFNDAAFAFVKYGYVWHFTMMVAAREQIMAETWRRVRANYPGADDPT
jgi:hypothetical protein